MRFLLVSLLACSSTQAPESDAFDAQEAEFALVECEQACDTQLRFECHDTSDFQWCDSTCGDVTPDIAESYARCVSASSPCDASCDSILEESEPEPATEPDPIEEPSCFDTCVSFAQACDPDMVDICGDACGLAEELVMSCIDSASGCNLTPMCEELVEG